MHTPIYSVEHGIGLSISQYQSDTAALDVPSQIDRHSMDALNIKLTGNDEDFAHLRDELADVRTVEIDHRNASSVVTSLAFEYSVLNQEAGPDSDLVVVTFGGLDSDYLKRGTSRTIIALALLDPTRRYLVGNAFSNGGSSDLPQSVVDELQRTGTYLPQGDLHRQAILATPEGRDASSNRTLSVAGESRGARITAGALATGLEARAARLVAPPGHIGGAMELFMAFMTESNTHAPAYDAASIDPHRQEFVAVRDERVNGKSSPAPSEHRQWCNMAEVEMLGLNGFDQELEGSLAHVSHNLDVISLGADELSDLESRRELVARLATNPNRPHGQILRHIIAEGLTHMWAGASPAGRALALVPARG